MHKLLIDLSARGSTTMSKYYSKPHTCSMEPIFNFLTIYAHVHLDFLCDIFLSISTSVRRKLAWDIFWHDLPLEGPKVNLTLAHLKRRFTA